MNILISILFWAGVVLLADGSLGLIFEEKWQKLARGIRIRRWALMEIGLALGMLCAYVFLKH